MKTSDFYYDLPQELIAQDPLEDRDSSRLMVLGKKDGAVKHRFFRDITEYLKRGDCLVINNTKVIPARLYGIKEDTGAQIEILLLKRKEKDIWETLVKPGKKAKTGAKISFGEGLLFGEILDVVEEGNRLPISPIPWRIKADTRQCTPNTTALRQRQLQGFILRRNSWIK